MKISLKNIFGFLRDKYYTNSKLDKNYIALVFELNFFKNKNIVVIAIILFSIMKTFW